MNILSSNYCIRARVSVIILAWLCIDKVAFLTFLSLLELFNWLRSITNHLNLLLSVISLCPFWSSDRLDLFVRLFAVSEPLWLNPDLLHACGTLFHEEGPSSSNRILLQPATPSLLVSLSYQLKTSLFSAWGFLRWYSASERLLLREVLYKCTSNTLRYTTLQYWCLRRHSYTLTVFPLRNYSRPFT